MLSPSRKTHLGEVKYKKGSLRAAQLIFWVLPRKPFGFSWMAPLELESFPPPWEPLMTNLQLNYTLFSLPFQGKEKKKKCLCKAISEVIKISPRASKHFPSLAFPSASAPKGKTPQAGFAPASGATKIIFFPKCGQVVFIEKVLDGDV